MNYADIIIEGVPSGEEQHSPPVLPEEYMRENLGCIPRIPIPGERFVFFTRCHKHVHERLLADERVRPQILACSWTELFFGNYPYWDWVFDADITDVIDGRECRIRRKIKDVTNQRIHGIYVPGIFQGDELPELPMPKFLVNSYQRLRNDVQLIVPTVKEISRELINHVHGNPALMNQLQPRQFEEFICVVLTKLGWAVELTPATRDGGYDIIGFSGSPGGVKSSWIIECKKYAPENKVGVGIVRALCGVKEQTKHGNAMIVTTSSFTRGALEWENNRWDLTLKDQAAIVDWVSSIRNDA